VPEKISSEADQSAERAPIPFRDVMKDAMARESAPIKTRAVK